MYINIYLSFRSIMLNGNQHSTYGSITVERPYYEQEQLNNELSYTKPKTTGNFINIFFFVDYQIIVLGQKGCYRHEFGRG